RKADTGMVLAPVTLISRKVNVTVSTARPSGVRDGASMLKSKSGWVGISGPGRSLRPGCTAPGKVAAVGCANAPVAHGRQANTLTDPSAKRQTRERPDRPLQSLAVLTQIPSPRPDSHGLPYICEYYSRVGSKMYGRSACNVSRCGCPSRGPSLLIRQIVSDMV